MLITRLDERREVRVVVVILEKDALVLHVDSGDVVAVILDEGGDAKVEG